jgi:hypothetical protein
MTEKLSKAAQRIRASLTAREAFFFDNAGYSYHTATEKPEQGRARCARELARAEVYAGEQGWEFTWEDDWMCGSHVREFGRESYEHEPSTCESCVLRDAEGNVLASLGCIDDADSNYRRVIEAELASEALDTIEQAVLRDSLVDAFIERNYAL